MNLLLLTMLIAIALNSVLTVPYGFVGVRGKKSLTDAAGAGVYDAGDAQKYDYDSEEDRLWNYIMQLEASQKQNYRPVRPWDHQDVLYEKKLPLGFSAGRGKRSAVRSDR
ncbi:unnamed protein product [Phyllotreta striolata]|uniref:Uncharacterized protein n=1 Tax=Phyllotreta striolata TaxID=444603 RepID=A0A9P0DX11_PHYSR|nr:unnamed protein product [Phyllotreta striolata]